MMDTLHHWANDFLVWVGFGTLVGLAAKAVLPGRDSGGSIATILMGACGTMVGSGMLALFWEGGRVTPLSPLGFVAATLGSVLLLVCHRMLAGKFFHESGTGPTHPPRGRRRVTVQTTD
jgi:uncharacterized membrane protein YeaQ/YmgE (transglycosylase-associated protein family)